jgi:hypothetical protein
LTKKKVLKTLVRVHETHRTGIQSRKTGEIRPDEVRQTGSDQRLLALKKYFYLLQKWLS